MKPSKSISDPTFEYTPSAKMGSDYLTKKFKQMEREHKKAREEEASKVRPITNRRIA